MDTVAILIFSVLAVPAAIIWYLRRQRIHAGHRCWECGADLRPTLAAAGHARVVRCPECGHPIDHDDEDDEPDESDEPPFDDDDEFHP